MLVDNCEQEICAHLSTYASRSSEWLASFFLFAISDMEICVRIPGTENFLCNMCDYTSFTRYRMRRHYLAKHTNIRFTCHICNKSWSQEGHRLTHYKSFHGLNLTTGQARAMNAEIDAIKWMCRWLLIDSNGSIKHASCLLFRPFLVAETLQSDHDQIHISFKWSIVGIWSSHCFM